MNNPDFDRRTLLAAAVTAGGAITVGILPAKLFVADIPSTLFRCALAV